MDVYERIFMHEHFGIQCRILLPNYPALQVMSITPNRCFV